MVILFCEASFRDSCSQLSALWKYDLESKFRQRAFDRVRPYDKLNLFRNNTDSICTSVNPCVLLLWGFWNGISFFVVPDKRFRFATFLRSLRYYGVSVRPAPFSTFSNDETTSIGLFTPTVNAFLTIFLGIAQKTNFRQCPIFLLVFSLSFVFHD